MRLNSTAVGPVTVTHEGTPAPRLTPIKTLRRLALTALLWEDAFYESGSAIAAQIATLVPQCKPTDVAALAVEARDRMYLRHVPLYLVRLLAKQPGNGTLVAETLAHVIQRPDELTEYLALYWQGQNQANPAECDSLSAGSKRGLARAFAKFTASTLAKYDKDNVVKLRDVLRLTCPKPKNAEQAATWKQVTTRTLESPDTWEVNLSAGKNSKETFERLLREGKLGGLAFLRNLRNMIAAGVDESLIIERCHGNFDKVLPFRFITAARHAVRFEPYLEQAMLKCLAGLPHLEGRTALIIDTSPSMWQDRVSAKSELSRFDAAAALAILARELCTDVHVWAFNSQAHEIPSRRGFALRDTLAATQGSYSCGGLAVDHANARGYDRIIVLTDGQWHYIDKRVHGSMAAGKAEDVSPKPLTAKAYMVNLAPYANGVQPGTWHSINGWSEAVLDYIAAVEREDLG